MTDPRLQSTDYGLPTPAPVRRPQITDHRLPTSDFWRGKRVLITGYTGFKGGWLSLWLSQMGAEVHGYALKPPTEPNFYTVSGLHSRLESSTIADIRDAETLTHKMKTVSPEIVLHLAAQPIVRYSYSAPVETYAVNVMGTVNLLEAVRSTSSVKAIVNVTTDKCYENREWERPYTETDSLGGYDPYSSSKACSELVTAAYRRSFLAPAGIQLASARSGNVIGGGDWAEDRLIPDFLRALDAGKTLKIRSPQSTRPWQHVLEPISGYLLLAQNLYNEGADFAEAWNFGPEEADTYPVKWIIEHLCNEVPNSAFICDEGLHQHEANFLKIDSSKAKAKLGWYPHWNLHRALKKTLDWHQAWKKGLNMEEFSLSQISEYEEGR